MEQIREALNAVYDPCCAERGISVVDMGLLRSIDMTDGRARIQLLLTSGWCPFASRVLDEVKHAAEAVPGVDAADVEIVWDEAWTTDRLSPEASQKLRLLPDPVAIPDRDTYLRQPAGTEEAS